MCVVAAELWLLVLHAAAELYCVLYDVPHYENKMPRKAYYQITLYFEVCTLSEKCSCTYFGKKPIPRWSLYILSSYKTR